MKVYHPLEKKGCLLSVKTSRGVSLRTNRSVMWPMTALAVVEGHLEKEGILAEIIYHE